MTLQMIPDDEPVPFYITLNADEYAELLQQKEHWKASFDRAVKEITGLRCDNNLLGLANRSLRAELVVKEQRIHDLEGILEDQLGYVPTTKGERS